MSTHAAIWKNHSDYFENRFSDVASYDQNEDSSPAKENIRIWQIISRWFTADQYLSVTADLFYDGNEEYSYPRQEPDLSMQGLQTRYFVISLSEQLRVESKKQEKRLAGDALARFRASYDDALTFSSSLGNYQLPNVVATADDGEIVFEWYGKSYHLVVSFDGDGEYGYSYEVDGEIIAGFYEGFCDQDLPEDLRNYFNGIAAN